MTIEITESDVGRKPSKLREFETGAIRDLNDDKFDYKGFVSWRALQHFAAYMHENRTLPDGSKRSADNWKKGIPLASYEESMTRHVVEFLQCLERDDREGALDIAPAIWFNLQGWMHEMLKEGE